MRVIVAGSRGISEYDLVCWAIWDSGFQVTSVVTGCAPGVDALGVRWATERKLPVARYPANWNQWGRAAGPLRNQQMAGNADALVAVWDGKSPGTAHMIQCARRRGLAVHVVMESDWAPCDVRGWRSGSPRS